MGPLLQAFLDAFMPIAEKLLGGLVTYLMSLLQQYFPTPATAQAKAAEVIDGMERITTNVTNDPVKSLAWLKGAYASFDELESGNANYPAMPGIAQDIHARYVGMSDMQVPHNVVAMALHPGFANGRVKAAAAAKKP